MSLCVWWMVQSYFFSTNCYVMYKDCGLLGKLVPFYFSLCNLKTFFFFWIKKSWGQRHTLELQQDIPMEVLFGSFLFCTHKKIVLRKLKGQSVSNILIFSNINNSIVYNFNIVVWIHKHRHKFFTKFRQFKSFTST